MINVTFPKTDEAVEFIAAFGELKRIITVSDMVKLCSYGDDSEQIDWIKFLSDCARGPLNEMSKELCTWMSVNVMQEEEGEEIIEMLIRHINKLEKDLTHKHVTTQISDYNEKLKASKIKNKAALMLDENVANHTMRIIDFLINKFGDIIEVVGESFSERKEVLDTSTPARRGVQVKHQLRWNEEKKNFTKFFDEQIELKQILAYPDGSDKGEIYEILNAVFEKVSISNAGNKSGRLKLIEPAKRRRFYIPSKLLWNGTGTELAEDLGPLVGDGTIFIDKYDNPSERPSIAEVLLQVFAIGIKDEKLELSSMVKYLKDNK